MADASQGSVFADGFLAGFFDMVQTMLGSECSYSVTELAPADDQALSDRAAKTDVLFAAPAGEGGAIMAGLPASAVYAMANAFLGDEMPVKEALEEDDADTLKEVFGPCMGAGSSYFKEHYDHPIVLGEVALCAGSDEGAQTVGKLVKQPAYMAVFEFAAPGGIDDGGWIAFTEDLLAAVPEAVEGTAETESNVLDQNEIESILSSVGMAGEEGEQASAPSAGGGGDSSRPAPPNLDMVLDIRLVVKARLGRIEMPINEVLSLGPGSIINLGHMVDEPIELLVNDKLIARGDVVTVDEKFGLRITEIVSPRERIESLR